MRRIKTFGQLFEAQEQYELGKIHGSLEQATDELGLNWRHDWSGGLYSHGVALATGKIHRVNEMPRDHECLFRTLILSVLFGVYPPDEHVCKLMFFDDRKKVMLDFLTVHYHSDATTPDTPGTSNYYIGVSKQWGKEETIAHILKELQRIIGNVVTVRCELVPSHREEETSGLEPIIPQLMQAFASAALGEGKWVDLLCDVIREAGALRHLLMVRIRDTAPEIWQQIKPALGAGATELEDLADLGF